MTGKTVRTYRSPAREARARRTRSAVIEAAVALFVGQGFEATTVRAIAERSGVSVATVEQLFGTKVAVLAAAIDVTIAGDDEPVAMLDRAWVRELAEVGVEPMLERFVAAVADVAYRVAPLFGAVDRARGDSQVAALAAELDRNRRVIARWLVRQLESRHRLSDDLTESLAVQTALVLLDPAVHRRMIIDWRWSRPRFRSWLHRSISRLLVAPVPPGART